MGQVRGAAEGIKRTKSGIMLAESAAQSNPLKNAGSLNLLLPLHRRCFLALQAGAVGCRAPQTNPGRGVLAMAYKMATKWLR
jgi:hypothetical protein